MRLSVSAFILLGLFLLLTLVSCDDLIQVQILHRHCDRTPTSDNIIPNCPIDLKSLLKLGSGLLTPLGEFQCHSLGKFIRDRYLSPTAKFRIRDIDSKYSPSDYYFTSSPFPRTLRSAWSVSTGLFPVGHQTDVFPYPFSLPNGSQSVPITSVAPHNNRLFLDYDLCPAILTNIETFFLSPEGLKLLAHWQPRIEEIKKVAGIEAMTLLDIPWFFDLVDILADHGLLCAALQDIYGQIREAATAWRSALFSPKIVGDMAGGDIAESFLEQMDSLVRQGISSEDNITSSSGGDGGNGGGKKFVHYSGHDTSVTAAQYAMRMLDDYPEFGAQPEWGATLILELWEKSITTKTTEKKEEEKIKTRKNENSEPTGEEEEAKSEKEKEKALLYYVRVHYKTSWNGELMEDLSLKSLGCGDDHRDHGIRGGGCDYATFSSNLRSKSVIPVKEWCKVCGNTEDENCVAARVEELEEKLETSEHRRCEKSDGEDEERKKE